MSWVIGMTCWPSTLASAMAPTASTNDKQEADDDAGHGQRQVHLLEDLPARGAEIEGGTRLSVRHHADAQGHREQHERQGIHIDHAEHDDAAVNSQLSISIPDQDLSVPSSTPFLMKNRIQP